MNTRQPKEKSLPQPHILHVAAENDRLPGCKVGGIGDVVRDIAPALAELGCRVTLLTPSYGYLHRRRGAQHIGGVGFMFRGGHHWADIYEVPGDIPHPGVRNCVIQHPWIEAYDRLAGRHRIYVDDTYHEPFYTDASRFACFSAAASAAITQDRFGPVHVLHLHDWHTAFVALLNRFSPPQPPRTVFSIHNLSIQGLRPLRHNESSLEAWFPGLPYHWIDVGDPQWSGCVNPMAMGIRLADVVHTVSPTYAEEICHPSGRPHYYGAERLESVIRYHKDGGRLIGILNGCEYPAGRKPARVDMPALAKQLQDEVVKWGGRYDLLAAGYFVAYHRLSELGHCPARPQLLLTSVSRVVEQKFLLMRVSDASGRPALQRILEALGERGYYLLLGSGDSDYEHFFARMSARFRNFIFLNGYSERCARLLYGNGDLFLMPSSFEPCGIGQMLAMRNGQPCVGHAVGGLRDTIQDQVNGFCFSGNTIQEQADNLVQATCRAMDLASDDPRKWRQIGRKAAAARFLWQDTARRYMEQLYELKVKKIAQKRPRTTRKSQAALPAGKRRKTDKER
jgi:starch synthase